MHSFIDAHNHLQAETLDPHRAEVIAALEQMKVGGVVVNGTAEDDWEKVASLAQKYPWVLPSYGLHPWYVARRTADWQMRLRERLDAGRCGVGEIGLDRWMKGCDFDDQRAVFSWQLALAAERNLPVTIHCLQAWGVLAEMLREQAVPSRGFLLHAYGGPGEMIEEFTKCGAYFSFNGYFLHPRKAGQCRVFSQVPLDRLLVETDAPSMALPPERAAFTLPDSADGKPVNHPANIEVAYEALAGIRGVTIEQLAAQVAENFARLFD